MSGKSTLLRAIGVNAVLAQAGGPVCADALTLPPVAVWTSARVQDSLERGVSFFMAELQRLKLIVDAATRANELGGPRVLYLLDEILHGTNTAERGIAARRVIAYLVEQGAIGAVSTHDLALADDPRLRQAAESVHFTDTVGEGPDAPPMSFDLPAAPGRRDDDQCPAPDAPHRAGAGRRAGLVRDLVEPGEDCRQWNSETTEQRRDGDVLSGCRLHAAQRIPVECEDLDRAVVGIDKPVLAHAGETVQRALCQQVVDAMSRADNLDHQVWRPLDAAASPYCPRSREDRQDVGLDRIGARKEHIERSGQ